MSPKTILVVEDESHAAEVLAFVLEREGYRVLDAVNGRDGLNKLKLSPVDLIILDIAMPIMNGVEMASALRCDSLLRSVPVVITSALPESAVHGMTDCYRAFLRKPFPLGSLLSLVGSILAEEKMRA